MPRKPPGLSLSLAQKDTDEAPAKGDGAPVTETDRFESGGLTVDAGGVRYAAGGGEDEAMEKEGAVKFSDIEIVDKLGSGCSSVVQLARHKVTGQLYALKLISLFDKGVRDMLLSELKALFSADCDALIDFHGAMYREGSVAVILEFMDLGGLDRVIRKAPSRKIPEGPLAAMSFQMIFGLAYLAFERRVHRDIKPANILVHHDGRVKLTDFGISRELATAVLAKTFIGSFQYMSPERIRHEPYDYASDIWSLGLVLLEAATGSFPYPQATAQIAMVMTITEGDEPLPPREGGEFTPQFHDFLARCICKDPSRRASAAELLEDPWFEAHGVTDMETAVQLTRAWLESAGLRPEFTTSLAPPATSTASASAGGGGGGAAAAKGGAGAGLPVRAPGDSDEAAGTKVLPVEAPVEVTAGRPVAAPAAPSKGSA